MSDLPEPPPGFPGEHFPPGTSVPRAVSVSVGPLGLRIAGPDVAAQVWPFAELRLMRGSRAGEPVQIERQGPAVEVVIVAERGLLGQLREQLPAGTTLESRGGGVTGGLLLALALALVAVAVLGYRFGVPMLADTVADRVPPAWERDFGEAVVRDFAPEGARASDPVVIAPVARLHEHLAAAAAGVAAESRLVVVRGDQVNAFAAPGGIVVVTTGLLRAMRTPDELAAVLAHELGHVRRRHPMHGMMRQLSLQALVGLLAGDASTLSGGIQIAGQLGGLRYSRELEQEADDDALRLLAQEGWRPDALSRALESITRSAPAAGGLPGFLSTHPAPRQRLERIAASVRDVRVAEHPVELVSPEMWAAMKQALPAAKDSTARPQPGAGH